MRTNFISNFFYFKEANIVLGVAPIRNIHKFVKVEYCVLLNISGVKYTVQPQIPFPYIVIFCWTIKSEFQEITDCS